MLDQLVAPLLHYEATRCHGLLNSGLDEPDVPPWRLSFDILLDRDQADELLALLL